MSRDSLYPLDTVLPPAEEVEQQEYFLAELKAPRLTGWGLQAFVNFVESDVGFFFLRRKLFWGSGLTQVLERLTVPEAATYIPALPSPREEAGTVDVDVAADPIARLTAALNVLGGEGAIRGSSIPGRASIPDYHRAYREGAVTPLLVAERVAQAVLAGDARTPQMRYLAAHDANDMLRQAQESTTRWLEGRPLSVLDGVPFAVKDSIDAPPYETTCGTAFAGARNGPAKEASPIVAALKAAGAVLIGKASMHEIGIGTTGINIKSGTPRNPYNPYAFTGGSSSGSCALVASGIVPFTIGTDGGGSIRIPSALCGTVGLKTSNYRITDQGGSKAGSVVAFGPHTNTVADAILVYSVLGSKDIVGPQEMLNACHGKVPALRLPSGLADGAAVGGGGQPLVGLKIGVYRTWNMDCEPEVAAKCDAAINLMLNLGAEAVDITIPELELQRVAHTASITADMANTWKWALRGAARRGFNTDVRLSLRAAEGFSSAMHVQSGKIRTRMLKHHLKVLEQVDLIAMPTTPMPAQPISAEALHCGESNLMLTGALMRFAHSANFVGLPAISVPVGTVPGSLPVGLQLMGQPWGEATLLRIASYLEAAIQEAGLSLPRPEVCYAPLEGPLGSRAPTPEVPSTIVPEARDGGADGKTADGNADGKTAEDAEKLVLKDSNAVAAYA